MTRSIVAATANPKKLAEIEAIFGRVAGGVELAPRPAGLADVVEDGDTLRANAALKAEAVASAAGLPAIADDTGLEVDALDGAPGVRSARFAGDHATDADNVDLLLARLDGRTDRRARFRTVICLAAPGREPVFADGVCEGSILLAPRGDGGFGYDPVFVPDDGDGRSFAEMTAEEKHAISHRGRAMSAAAEMLDDFLAHGDVDG
ncbi:MAG TPA: RdgB/HAM1 family non-canonical purine NTP pyrophosphatase [Microthrixaceae bacterium]|nr:RdgB/HAM1 family non-canonical purine NTP pyrophosphatase [Microthrixaceae bacterium]HNI34356.1 RdgB/HAM1 family non-canonical purine NTP pyrophosphatase [Microthrixaceae bacterium]